MNTLRKIGGTLLAIAAVALYLIAKTFFGLKDEDLDGPQDN